MLLILAEVLRSCAVASVRPGSLLWGFVCSQQTHAAWTGASLHDLIQPSFYFLVGVASVLSLERRLASGQSVSALTRHAMVRASVLVVLGLCMVSVHPREWVWDFTDTLTQIGLAYPFLFLLGFRRPRDWLLALVTLLVGYWAWFALFPVPPGGFDYATVSVPNDWVVAHGLTGFFAHWQKNTNAAAEFDRWFLNQFPRDAAFVGNPFGLATLNFVPSLGTMILGLFAGRLIKGTAPPAKKLGWLSLLGGTMIVGGASCHVLGVCPIVKAIWTPAWVVFSGGWCFLLLAVFYALVDLVGLRRAAFPLIVIGTNSIAAYVLSHLYPALAFNAIRRLFGDAAFDVFGAAYSPFMYGCAVLFTYWLILFALYRRRIFLRI